MHASLFSKLFFTSINIVHQTFQETKLENNQADYGWPSAHGKQSGSGLSIGSKVDVFVYKFLSIDLIRWLPF